MPFHQYIKQPQHRQYIKQLQLLQFIKQQHRQLLIIKDITKKSKNTIITHRLIINSNTALRIYTRTILKNKRKYAKVTQLKVFIRQSNRTVRNVSSNIPPIIITVSMLSYIESTIVIRLDIKQQLHRLLKLPLHRQSITTITIKRKKFFDFEKN